MFAVAMIAGRRIGKRRPSSVIRMGYILLAIGMAVLIPLVPRVDSGLWLAIPLVIAGAGLGLLVSQLNNYTLAPISGERISEAAGVNSAAGSFGLSLGLALAGGLMLAALSLTFISMTESSTVLPPDDKEHIAAVLEEDAQLLSTTQLELLVDDQPEEIGDEVVRINTEARPIALQIALLVPLVSALLGLVVSLRMGRLPDIVPNPSAEEFALG
jgi:hypothetical protein